MLKHVKSSEDWNEKSLGAKGFTLIELLVVIIILGILAAVAIFAIGSIRGDAEKSACESEIGTVETAIAAWMVNTDANPQTAITSWGQLDNLRKTPSHVLTTEINTDGTVSTDCSS